MYIYIYIYALFCCWQLNLPDSPTFAPTAIRSEKEARHPRALVSSAQPIMMIIMII